MKLAEALILRADCQKRFAQLKSRLNANAKVQEGDRAAEDPKELFTEIERVAEQLARAGTSRHDHGLGRLEVLAGLLLRPARRPRREALQPQRGAAAVARHATGMALAFFEQQRLDACFVEVVVESGRCGWRGRLLAQ